MPRRIVAALIVVSALAAAGAATGRVGVGTSGPAVVTYPAAQTIPATGRLPNGGASSITLNEPIGGDDAALVVVSNAKQVGLLVDTKSLGGIVVGVRFRHFVRFGSALVPDALLPWDGSVRPTEQQNQPLSIEVSVPYGTNPGVYKSTATLTVDTKPVVLPLTITVYNVQLPKPGDTNGSLLSVFGVGPQAYVNRATELFGYKTDAQIRAANASLFAFLSAYRIAPDSWGFGIPSSASGYTSSSAYWKDSAGDMVAQLQAGQFSDLWIPISNNRAKASSYIAGLSPSNPEAWCGYLGAVSQFWAQHGFLQNGAIPYIYPYDEPGDTHASLLARQATAVHKCFPGGKMLVTATPDTKMSRLYDGKGTDDVDIWAAVDWRYYGVFTVPAKQKYGSRMLQDLTQINKARATGKRIFAYTYYGVPGFPSFAATEPLSNPRMFVLWTALEGIDGILYAQGMTTYGVPGNPLDANIGGRGESVLIYPGDGTPIASARLEQIRSGIEDWEIFAAVRKRFGAAKVRQILGSHGLFSATASGVQLACVVGCDLKGTTSQAWPRWSHDATTAGRIDAARLDALRVASGR